MKYVLAILLAAYFANGVYAEPVTYECQLKDEEGYGWIAPNYIFVIDTETLAATNASNHYDFTKTRFKIDRKGRYRLFWKAKLKSEYSAQKFEVHYTAHITPADNTVRMRGNIISHKFRNRPIGSGVCRVQK